MTGKSRNLPKPSPLVLCGNDLPWVESATHLGHELNESGSMDHDALIKRAQFVQKSVEIRSMFHWAAPADVITALKTYCSSFYGSMLWDLSGASAKQVFTAWDVAVKLVWDCPRATRTFLLQQVLSCGLSSAKTDVLCRYSKFFNSLRNSVSMEVRVLCNLVAKDLQSTTAKNVKLIEDLTNHQDICTATQESIREALITSERVTVSPQDEWRTPYLSSLLSQYQEAKSISDDGLMEYLNSLICSLAIG